ncbi:MAG: hypothetical protein WCV00_20730 [Verrucomicrobiia bacterium]|jgi:hypothetical protein
MPIRTFQEFMASLVRKTEEEVVLRFELVMTDIQILVVQLHREALHRLTRCRTGRGSTNSLGLRIDLQFFAVQWNSSSATVAEMEADLKFIDENLASSVNSALGALKDRKLTDVITHMKEFDRNYQAYFGKEFSYDRYATAFGVSTLPNEIAGRKALLKSLMAVL